MATKIFISDLFQGDASMCCRVHVRPYLNQSLRAIALGPPVSQALLSIRIYARFAEKWVLFRAYERKILPYSGNYLHMNGYENVADVFVFADAGQPRYQMRSTGYYYDVHSSKLPHYQLLE